MKSLLPPRICAFLAVGLFLLLAASPCQAHRDDSATGDDGPALAGRLGALEPLDLAMTASALALLGLVLGRRRRRLAGLAGPDA